MEARMEKLVQIKGTLEEIGGLIPDILRAAVGLEHHFQAVSTGTGGETGSEVTSSPQKPKQEQDGDDEGRDGGGGGDGDGEGEGEGEGEKALRMDWASCYVPYHDEDAHFGHDGPGVVGVADGVGGFRRYCKDAGAFARGLMTSALAQVVAMEPGTPVCPYALLERAYDETVESGAPGASTAVILSLAGDVLKWAYIGDSGFAVLRGGKVVECSVPQQEHFNAPYYLRRGGGKSITEVKASEMRVRNGDVVVAGTDGLFDNMSDADLEKIVQIGTALGFSSRTMADVIGGAAFEMSRCTGKDSPFAVESWKQERVERHRYGGKADDITVVVARIL
ncbi:putative protein phosphatase 2C 23 [Oryza brachyantha]|uniref:putative protein phosphatase 2C 23 n=1 Tax=Oryza brachyantha TaxID=4533 RepID=UPI001ADB4D56|nr:putative protein phosphatase 2C 23 [Oryza brachyantha]